MKKTGIVLLKILLGLMETILILVIVINILLILSDKVLKKPYPSIMDYTYLTIEKSDKYLGINKGDLLILDIRKAFKSNDIVYYRDYDEYKLGKIEEIIVENVLVKNDELEENTTKGLVEGTLIITIKKLGTYVSMIFQPISLAISIVILTIVTISQNFINKKTKQGKENKPDFKKMKHYN